MGRDEFLGSLADDAKCAAFGRGFLRELTEPAFGARSKSELEALAVKHLVDAGLLDLNSSYGLARALNVTSQKARAITLQYQLRSNLSDARLDEDLRKELAQTRYGRDGTLLAFGLESPILQQHLFGRLKERKTFADTSFSKEIARLPVEAFVDFVGWRYPERAEAVRKALVKDKVLPDTSFKAVAKDVVMKLAEKVGDKAFSAVADKAADQLTDFVKSLVTGDGGEALKVLDNSEVEVA